MSTPTNRTPKATVLLNRVCSQFQISANELDIDAFMNYISSLESVVDKTRKTRAYQAQFYKTRDKQVLNLSIASEKDLDKTLSAL